MNRKILIAGGAGFIGSHLCEYYVSSGHEVVCLDNLSTGRKTNIETLEGRQNFSFYEADVSTEIPPEIENDTFDVIINLASPASPPQYERLALETLRVGSVGVENLLKLAMKDDARFLQASTSEVYGDPDIHPQPESYHGNVNSYGPRSMYDEAKRYAEALIYTYHHKYGANTIIVRIFNTYGPRMDPMDGRVVSNFITQALEGKSITIYGDGTQTRSFCYIDDLVKGLVRAVDSQESGPINIGNPAEYTVAALAQQIINQIGSNSTIEYSSLPVDDPKQRKPDIALAKSALGWEPEIPLHKGLRLTTDYFRKEVGKEPSVSLSCEIQPMLGVQI